MKFFFLLICFYSLNSFSQVSDSEKETMILYKNLISRVSNNFVSSPKLKISNTNEKPAKISNGIIYIEKKLIDLFYSSDHFEAMMAYVISHELGHHYLNHGWAKQTGFAYKNDKKNISLDDRELLIKESDEEQADLWGGFFSQVAGYNSLAYAKDAIYKIYDAYNIPNEIKGYPSLERRIKIIDINIDKVKKLTKLFDIGNISLLFNMHDLAEICFSEILNNNVQSPEIFNNLGVSYLLKAINSDPKLKSLNYPIFINDNTSIRIKTRSSFSELINPIELLEKSLTQFHSSLKINESDSFTKMNIAVSKMLIQHLSGSLKKSFLRDFKKSKFISDDSLNELEELYSSLNSRNSHNNNRKIINSIPNFKRDAIGDFELNRGFSYRDDYVTYNGYMSNLVIKEKDYSDFKIYDLQDSYNRNRLMVICINDIHYLNSLKSIIDRGNLVFDRIMKLGEFVYKIDYSGKIAMQFDGENLISAIIYKEID